MELAREALLAELKKRILVSRGQPEIVGADTALECFSNMRILVTGAGGSVGSEIVSHLAKVGAGVIALDRDEAGLQRLSRMRHAEVELVLADIRDKPTLEATFRNTRPIGVIHCAALKHVDLLEMFPREAFLTNVTGTLNVLGCAERWGSSVINLSTDKAAQPSCMLGYSKRIGERLCSWFDRLGTGAKSVRLANVIGSRGSATELFVDQALRGVAITLTDPSMTRYFMTSSEVSGLIGAAWTSMRGGWCGVADLGKPVSIRCVATHVSDIAKTCSPIRIDGPRPGESLHETLYGPDETPTPLARHSNYSEISIPALNPAAVVVAGQAAYRDEIVARLRDLASETLGDALVLAP